MIVIDTTFVTRDEFNKLISLNIPIIFIGDTELLPPVESGFPSIKELLNASSSHSNNGV